MKRKTKLVAAAVLASLSFCIVIPKTAEAGFYVDNNDPGKPYFATDSYVRADGQYGWAYSANYECEGSNQSVIVNSIMDQRDPSTGEFTRRISKSGNDFGADASVEVEHYVSHIDEEIYYVFSRHTGNWNGQSLSETTSDSL